ncbi:(E2-independent) E3 ubiquitin-conjugating enzyme FATS [Ictalurus punctatus]|uniref:(E2-independent) E3 ubiquitin-conjugating enzyme FATS n=1 Tax=Ictalurus punctatus TaxID=7998 RepID=A0A2D0RME5_ICTPU|nr:(E2-independent) E3 ubiquitin-conjugating enzyme FATS [Ictalurus punctatus]
MVPRPQECVVSSHLLNNCTYGSKITDQLQLLSLKEALQFFRPDFILRSQRRVHRLEQRARERRGLQPGDSTVLLQTTNRRQNCTKPHPLSDNLFKPKDRVISGKEMHLRSRRIYNKLPEVTKKKEEERRRLVLQTNRLRAEAFKKKLLDQLLQRNSD